MNKENNIKFPCPNKPNGEYVIIEQCNICINKDKCDTYITMLNENND